MTEYYQDNSFKSTQCLINPSEFCMTYQKITGNSCCANTSTPETCAISNSFVFMSNTFNRNGNHGMINARKHKQQNERIIDGV